MKQKFENIDTCLLSQQEAIEINGGWETCECPNEAAYNFGYDLGVALKWAVTVIGLRSIFI